MFNPGDKTKGDSVDRVQEILKKRVSGESFNRLMAIPNAELHAFVADAIDLANPKSVYVCTDSLDDRNRIRQMAVNGNGERPLATPGHTYHFDGINDQGRDKEVTKYLLPEGMTLGASLNSTDKKSGLAEVRSLLKGSMDGREMIVCFLCLCPTGSEFSISCVQMTDSPYVAHSEDMLYRPGYEQFKKVCRRASSSASCTRRASWSTKSASSFDKKRIYIDLEDDTVYTVNTQYAGNTVGLKKLALRLAIRKADREGWLAEHMFVMGVHGPQGPRDLLHRRIPVGLRQDLHGHAARPDDHRRRHRLLPQIDGKMFTANVERGIFGIIEDVNAKDDPVIYHVLTTPGEVIFSNVLISRRQALLAGHGHRHARQRRQLPGRVAQGQDRLPTASPFPPSHKNARYTISLSALANLDPEADNPAGVPVGGIIYGGRDSDTLVPVEQAFDWTDGIIAKGASLEARPPPPPSARPACGRSTS